MDRTDTELKFFLERSDLRPLLEKALDGARLSIDEGTQLIGKADLNALGLVANAVCESRNGKRASYVVNRYINYSNYCILSCQFCAFSKKKRDQDGFQLSLEDMVAKAREALKIGITELHIVGGLHPSLPFSYYTDMVRELKNLDRGLRLKCFTAIEIHHLAWLSRQSIRETLVQLKEAGLDSLTGGGAEIFDARIRSQIAVGKESAEEYLDVHRTWHQLGGRSTCTMLFGHLESRQNRIEHLAMLRDLQDETSGFTGFIPLAYQPENNRIPVKHSPTGAESLRTIALSRLMLDNFDHITAYWVGLGTSLAQIALNYGADDLHGTILEEKIFHMAGAGSPQHQTVESMTGAIREAGKIPVQRDTFYQPVGSGEPIPA